MTCLEFKEGNPIFFELTTYLYHLMHLPLTFPTWQDPPNFLHLGYIFVMSSMALFKDLIILTWILGKSRVSGLQIKCQEHSI